MASPYIAPNDLKSSFESGDEEDIEERVDFPALRQNIKFQLKEKNMREVGGRADDNSFAELASGLATIVIDKSLDTLGTPAGIARLITGQPINTNPGQRPSQPRANTRRSLLSEARFVRQVLDRVRVWVPNDYGDPFQVVMERCGARWKLTNVVLSDLRSDEN